MVTISRPSIVIGDDALTRQLRLDLLERDRSQPVQQRHPLQFPFGEDRQLIAAMGDGVGHRFGWPSLAVEPPGLAAINRRQRFAVGIGQLCVPYPMQLRRG